MAKLEMIRKIKELVRLELGLNLRDKTFLNKKANEIELKKNMIELLALSISEVFEDGLENQHIC